MGKIGNVFQTSNFYDYSKHVTTLSISALVFLVTFADKFANKPIWPNLFIGGIISLLVAVIVSIIAMLFILSESRYEDYHDIPSWEINATVVSYLLQVFFLIIGLCQLAIFTTKNFG
jgi:uncharacterized membrane protein (DUF485 family)